MVKAVFSKVAPEILETIPTTPEQIEAARKRLAEDRDAGVKCRICRDGLFVHPIRPDGTPDYSRTVPCQCVRVEAEERRKINLLKYCELPEKGRKMTFESFIVSKHNKAAYEACLAMAKGECDYNMILLTGRSTRGKTHLGVAACNYRLNQGQVAKYAYVPLLLKELRDGFGERGDGSYKERYDTFLNVPMLMLDDLGTENPTPWVQEHLDTLIDYRLMHQLPTIVTTNLLLHELEGSKLQALPFRIAHRLERDGLVIPVLGEKFSGK